MTSSEHSQQSSKIATVFRVTSGNFLEMFDFFLFGFYASHISAAFFPTGNEISSLLLTFATFGAGFLMRPLGAIVLGAYVDRVGRRRGLIVTLSIMAMGTILIAFVPAYATIGVAAPFLVLIGRLLQGFSAGVELGGVSVYLSEMATPGHKGFYVSWQSASQQVAIVVAALLGYGLNKWLAPDQISAWGWRIPFFIGCLIVPFIFVIRRSLQETEAFLARKHRPSVPEIFRSIVENWQIVVCGVLLVTMTFTAYPALSWLVADPSFEKMLLVELWLSFLYASYNGAMVVALTEIVPASVRTAGFSLAYSLATALGGFTPYISTQLIQLTGDKAAPGLWMMFAAACGLLATFLVYRRGEADRVLVAAAA